MIPLKDIGGGFILKDMGQGHLVDRFNRIATNLRVSVTDICNLRCTYCMSEDTQFIDESKIMTFDEIDRLIQIAVSLGVNKVRITGGEPLVRRNLPDLISPLKYSYFFFICAAASTPLCSEPLRIYLQSVVFT